MIESSIARRYAKALVEIGKETGEMSRYLEDLEGFRGVCQQHQELFDALTNRFIDLGARLTLVDVLCQKLGFQLMTGHFLKVLIHKSRMELLDFIVNAYRRYVYDHENKLEAVITTARPLADADYLEIAEILHHLTGKKIVAEKQVKPEVLGGVSVRMGGEVFDGTVKTRLAALTAAMAREPNYT